MFLEIQPLSLVSVVVRQQPVPGRFQSRSETPAWLIAVGVKPAASQARTTQCLAVMMASIVPDAATSPLPQPIATSSRPQIHPDRNRQFRGQGCGQSGPRQIEVVLHRTPFPLRWGCGRGGYA